MEVTVANHKFIFSSNFWTISKGVENLLTERRRSPEILRRFQNLIKQNPSSSLFETIRGTDRVEESSWRERRRTLRSVNRSIDRAKWTKLKFPRLSHWLYWWTARIYTGLSLYLFFGFFENSVSHKMENFKRVPRIFLSARWSFKSTFSPHQISLWTETGKF